MIVGVVGCTKMRSREGSCPVAVLRVSEYHPTSMRDVVTPLLARRVEFIAVELIEEPVAPSTCA